MGGEEFGEDQVLKQGLWGKKEDSGKIAAKWDSDEISRKRNFLVFFPLCQFISTLLKSSEKMQSKLPLYTENSRRWSSFI